MTEDLPLYRTSLSNLQFMLSTVMQMHLDPGITEITPRGYFFPVKELDREMLSVKTHCNFPASLKVVKFSR
jgi:hypothetical protein